MQKWTPKIQWPRDTFVLRCVEEKFDRNKNGNPMVTLVHEVVTPENYDIAGEPYLVAGTQTTTYHVTRVFDGEDVDSEKSANTEKRMLELYKQFEIDTTGIDWNNPPLGFKGKLFHALMYSDENIQRRAPSKEVLARNPKAEGEIIRHPITGKQLVNYYPKIGEIFGLAQADPNKPY